MSVRLEEINKSKEVRITREILFRAKRIDNGKWVNGYVTRIKHLDDKGKVESYYFNALDKLGWTAECVVYADTVCQYTGSIDIGMERIWENDFVETDGAIGIVKFGKYENGFHLGFHIYWINCPHLRNEICFWENNVRVIGNIFDNLEIAKEITDGSD